MQPPNMHHSTHAIGAMHAALTAYVFMGLPRSHHRQLCSNASMPGIASADALYVCRMLTETGTGLWLWSDKWSCCSNVPGTLPAGLAQELGLVHQEITLVMTDVQASSKLWEW